jgi:hypothetical protein
MMPVLMHRTFGWDLINQYLLCIKILMKTFIQQFVDKNISLYYLPSVCYIFNKNLLKRQSGHTINKKDNLYAIKFQMKQQIGSHVM